MGQEKNSFWCGFFSQKEMGVEIIYIIYFIYLYIVYLWKRNGIYIVCVYIYIYRSYNFSHIRDPNG